MAETLTIRTASSTEIVKIAVPGPQGPKGDKGDPGDVAGLPLSAQGDTLYRGASQNERLPIGSTGQILKVSAQGLPAWANESGAVTSVNGQTGAVTVSVPTASSSTPSALGTAAAGTGTAYAREDHVHSADLSDSAFRVVGSSDATKKVAFEVDAIATATTRTITVPDANITLDDSGDSRTPTAHAASHAAGTKAEYNDQVAGMTESVLIRADNTGTAGNSITLTFDGVDDIDTVLAAWNSANPSNQATLIEGDGSQVPDSDEQITLAGGAGDDPLFDQNLNTTDKPKFDGLVVSRDPSTTTLANAVHVANFVAQDNTNQAPLVAIGGTGNIEVYKDSAISKALAYGFAQPGQTATDDYIVSLYDGSAWNKRLQIAQSGTASVFGNLVVRDNTGNETATFDAQGNLTANRTYDLPDASGTLALISDIPALGTGAGEAAEGNHAHGNLTSDGKLGTTAGLPVVTTTAGAVTTLALGAAGQVLTVNGTADGVEFAAASGGGVTAVNSTLADILSVSGSDLVADDLGSDKLYGWDDSESKAIGFTIGSGLSVSGETLSATASGGSKTYAVFTATDNQPPATGFATLDTRNSIAVLDFDDATDESAVFVSIIPEGASLGSGLKIRLHWMATTATSGNVVWDVSVERMTTDLDSDSFDTIASGTAAANGTSGILTVTEITLTTIDSVTAGDGFRLKVTRDANNASDTMTGDAELVVCEVRSAA